MTPPVIGWREWVSLPDLGVEVIKAKVDTGARTSALHAFHLERFRADGRDRLRFVLHPLQRDATVSQPATADLLDYRRVRSSNGRWEERPTIRTRVALGADVWPVEITLTRRDAMGFRMLLGRTAIRGHFVVDPGHSFLAGDPLTPPLRP